MGGNKNILRLNEILQRSYKKKKKECTSENIFKVPGILSRNGRVPEVTNCLQVIWSN